MPDGVDLAVTDDHLGIAIEDRRHQNGDVPSIVLTIGIGVDDDIRPALEGRIDPRRKGNRQTTMNREPDNVRSGIRCHPSGLIIRAIINDQDFHPVKPRDLSGEGGNSLSQVLFLVPGRDLYDEFHHWSDQFHKVAHWPGPLTGPGPAVYAPFSHACTQP
jgi:hypothetical protein